MERHNPTLIGQMACRATHWAVYVDSHKLIHVQDTRDELFDLALDPTEQTLLRGDDANRRIQRMQFELQTFLDHALAYRLGQDVRNQVDLDDKHVRDRLRGLGYIE
jgi:hypothetical protein